MGSFFNNVYVKHGDPAAVEACLEEVLKAPEHADRLGDVEPAGPGWVLVVDGGQVGEEEIALRLSAGLGCAAVSVWVYDSEAWGYTFCDRGRVVDRHVPGPFRRGRPRRLEPYLGREGVAELGRVLRERHELAEEGAEAFVRVLGAAR